MLQNSSSFAFCGGVRRGRATNVKILTTWSPVVCLVTAAPGAADSALSLFVYQAVAPMFRCSAALRAYISIEQVIKVVEAKAAKHESVRHVELIDVRSTGEVARTGLIPFAMNIPLPMLADVLGEDEVIDDTEFKAVFGGEKPTKGVTQLIFYCAHGVRSAVACEIAEQLNYTNSLNFSGSWAQWSYLHDGKGATPGETTAK